MQTIKNLFYYFKHPPRHIVVAASAWASKVITAFTGFISIRELILYLGEEKYAIYAIAYSLIGWFTISQFGIGSSLQNFISESRVKNNNYDKYMISALQLIVIFFTVSLLIIFPLSNHIQSFIFRKFGTLNEPIVLCVSVVTLITVMSGIAYNVLFAWHKGYIPNILPAIASTISLISIIILRCYTSSTNLTAALLIFLLPQMLLAVFFFIKTFKIFFTKFFNINIENIKALFLRASKFYLITLLGTIYTLTDYIIASQFLSTSEIVKYNIFMKIFLLPIFVYESLLAAIWPVRSEMYIKGNFREIKAMTFRYCAYGIFLMLIFTLLIIIFKDFVIKLLSPDTAIVTSDAFIAAFAVYAIIRSLTQNYITLLESVNVLRIFAISFPFLVTLNIFLQCFFAKQYGAIGILFSLILSQVAFIWIYQIKIYKILKHSTVG
ncbi:MAG: MATE family efflux transporter [Endomicrobium sp.]|jgi:O-antigen/teichoic acid export membrane protein|nr:MATE family efflux transporter [Endomicrobium sp.]